MNQGESQINQLIQALLTVRSRMLKLEAKAFPIDHDLAVTYRKSAHNLVHYLAMRQQDLRLLQAQLTLLGLSSLGRAESHALATVEAVLERLHQLAGDSFSAVGKHEAPDFLEGDQLLIDHTTTLFGPEPDGRQRRIMVTMPSEAADDYELIHNLLAHGMDCMRINCAHDNPTVWLQMISHLKQAEKTVGRSCKILMDLAGPKIRTGPLPPGEAVLKVKPQRDVLGRVTITARIWLAKTRGTSPESADNCLLLSPATWIEAVSVGDKLSFEDARGSHRKLVITDVTKAGCWAELSKTAYFVPGTELFVKKDKIATVGKLNPVENYILVKPGDTLVLTRNKQPGRSAQLDHRGQILRPAGVGCTLPKALQYVQVGEQIWFDDGKIGGVIGHKDRQQLRIRITQAKPSGTKLRSDKGINLPDSRLRIPALTADDRRDLAFVVQHADIVALSFVNQPQDVDQLMEQIRKLGEKQPAIVLKIETQTGFKNLPNLLLRLMQSPACGVMLARGDLAVECGFERLSEVQEEILWVCEAAHVPVIWATQVLETLAKTGLPSRAEITDAAMGHRSECVMLNKGPYILQTVDVLDGILRRMQAHQDKKNDLLRELQLAHEIEVRN